MARAWYAYIGTGSPFLAANYFKATVKPACINGTNICAIYAYNGDLSPQAPLSIRLQGYISNALLSNLAQPQDSGSVKKYVYLKG
ncbi:hypothetical protein HDF26_000840 [Pedobacter cryoconitis]|uniref:Uncharacterized protein n=1 Tax=Pedobacter cryoconitis TaxID=188932 RepID=A0A7W8ZPJ0_9SPHI|nr:hypothetical protein [Pedobacter cryoconitis]MBB5637831.1 hypothetical protein [Pedobacter cryoconitis]MBB6270413.1 hypothetical protein [Pedobacter cryoconitis]